MKITVTQLRKIIKEEVHRTLRENVGAVATHFMEIPNVSSHMRPMQFKRMVEKLAAKYPSINYLSPGLEGGGGYSREFDSFLINGSEVDLQGLAMDLDDELMGGAQSISPEDSFTSLIEPN